MNTTSGEVIDAIRLARFSTCLMKERWSVSVDDRPTVYRIRVGGKLDDKWSEWFDGMKIALEPGGAGPPLTMLTGVVVDQAALRGILAKIWNLNLTLVSVNQIETRSLDGR